MSQVNFQQLKNLKKIGFRDLDIPGNPNKYRLFRSPDTFSEDTFVNEYTTKRKAEREKKTYVEKNPLDEFYIIPPM
ncbi:MAG: hypothetical protein V1802_03580 [Candidatus Aenigmatarchaeota archaeon]